MLSSECPPCVGFSPADIPLINSHTCITQRAALRSSGQIWAATALVGETLSGVVWNLQHSVSVHRLDTGLRNSSAWTWAWKWEEHLGVREHHGRTSSSRITQSWEISGNLETSWGLVEYYTINGINTIHHHHHLICSCASL